MPKLSLLGSLAVCRDIKSNLFDRYICCLLVSSLNTFGSFMLHVCLQTNQIQYTFSGSNTDGSFTTVASKLFLGPWEKISYVQL